MTIPETSKPLSPEAVFARETLEGIADDLAFIHSFFTMSQYSEPDLTMNACAAVAAMAERLHVKVHAICELLNSEFDPACVSVIRRELGSLL